MFDLYRYSIRIEPTEIGETVAWAMATTRSKDFHATEIEHMEARMEKQEQVMSVLINAMVRSEQLTGSDVLKMLEGHTEYRVVDLNE